MGLKLKIQQSCMLAVKLLLQILSLNFCVDCVATSHRSSSGFASSEESLEVEENEEDEKWRIEPYDTSEWLVRIWSHLCFFSNSCA